MLLAFHCQVQAAPPDLTAAGAIATLKSNPNSTPVYGDTYNLGATGLRGWIYVGGGNGADGTITVQSRQILVTVASTPGSAVLAVDDVILGAMAVSSGTVPNFASDARKALGTAIGNAEKTGAGTLRVKRWRAGTTTDVNIAMTIMGDYTATAPYTCPKSELILTNARNKLVGQLLADPNFLTVGQVYSRPINGLALLAGVAPADPNYAAVQTRLQTFARALAASPPSTSNLMTLDVWSTGFGTLFLSEYYLSTGDAQVVTGLNNYTVALAKAQSRYGTFGHGGSLLKADGSLHGTIPPYGPVNSAGIPANAAIVMGKKALLAAGQPIDPEIDPAIQRGSDFFAWYVNKGPIPYGEHEPQMDNHSSNGKDASCAVLFGLQAGRPVETEYFSRMTTASFNAREDGHTGQGFNYLWGAMGANMGGSLAVAEYLKQIRWHLDLQRRTDGSFVYDSQEGSGGGTTADGTYLGACGYYDMNPTACYILTYALPLQRLYITGKNAIPANTLDATKVTNAISSATFKQDCPGFTTTQLIASLSEFDPVVRNYGAIELGKRSLSAPELTTLRNMVTGTDANGRMGACQTLGLLNDATALPIINQRIDKNIEPNSWVRAKAASAIRSYTPAAASAYRDSMLTVYTANATDPEVIVWDDPIQIANNYLSFALFGDAVYGGNNIASYTINAPKNLLYPAVKAGLKQPDSNSRSGAAQFCYNYLTLPDVQALTLDIIEVITTKSQADTMWSYNPQLSGINLLMKYNCAEGLPMALSMLDVKPGWGWSSTNYLPPSMDVLVTYGDSARWTLPVLNDDISTLEASLHPSDFAAIQPKLLTTIAAIEAATTSPSGIIHLLPLATPQVVSTTGAKAITLTGTSPRSAVTFTNVTAPAHGTLTGTAPNLIYTPNSGYTGPDQFTFQAVDSLTTSESGTVAIIVGTAGTGLKGEYYDNANFTNLKLTRTDAQVNFNWGTSSPNALLGADTFSVRWSGLLLVPETGSYTFSTLNSDGVRLYINGVLVINQFANQEINWNDSTSVNLTEGQMVEIQMDYFENTGSAVAKLKWTGPSFAGANGEIIGSQWLFDGAGMTRTPYAFAQSLTLLKNTSQAVTLAGNAGTLTYSVVTPPAHGTLTGSAPNLTYTPFVNYIGLDSFTFKVNNGTSDSAPATVSINVLPAHTFSVNFFAYGGFTTPEAQANLKVNTSMSAGLANSFTSGWTNIEVPWTPSAPQAPATLTSNRGSAATFVFKNCRNGGPYDWSTPRTTLLGDGNGNMMDGHVNSTLDGPYVFDMEMTGIPFAVYDVIFYIGANKDQYGDGTGVIKFNGGTDRAFTLKPGAFDGSFTEMVNATTQGNYIVFSGVTGPSFTTQTWGTGPGGFNHVGPNGFQIRETIVADTTPPTLTSSSIVDDKSGGSVVVNTEVNYTVTFSEDMDASTVSAADFGNAGTSAISVGTVSETSPGVFTVSVTPTTTGTLRLQVNAAAVLNDAAGNVLVTTSAISDDTTLTVLPVSNPACPLGILNLTANGGINPATNAAWAVGDKYRLAFVTRATTQATSTNIATYNTFVQGVANSSNLNLSGASWKVIGSTATVDARANTSTHPGVNGTGEAIFLVNGTTKIANNYADLWDSSINSALNLDERGALIQPSSYVFAGTFADGTKDVGFVLGNATNLQVGTTDQVNQYWIRVWNAAPTAFLPVYALSAPLTIINAADTTAPTLTSIVDDKSGGPVVANTLVNYTVTFSEDMDASTVSAADFGSAGTSAIAIGTVSETSPGVFTVPVTPTSAGTLRLRTNAAAVLNDAAGNALDTAAAIADDTTITVTSINTAPVGNAQSVSTPEDAAVPITLTATDGQGDSLTYIIVSAPTSGTLSGTAPNVTYTPATSYSGPDSFTFKANDGLLDSAPATVSITVTAVNDAPVANAQSVSTAEDTAKAITLAGTDAEGSALTYTIVTQPASGTLSGTAPNVTYTPVANYNGAASFTFKVNDGTFDSAPATVSITVTAVNDVPVFTINPIVAAGASESVAYTGQTLVGRATDVDAGATIAYSKVSGPAWLIVASNGTLSGTPPSGSAGLNSFVVRATDDAAATADATLQITVTGLPLPWVSTDIGTGMLVGSATHSVGTFTQAGSGIIGSTSDKLRYTYQTLTGDGEIIARISALQNTGNSSRVGVMIRDTLAANSKEIFMGMTGSNAYRWVRRTTIGGTTTSSNSNSGTLPNTWVRLVRSGTTITAYKSTNGTSWTSVGSTTNTTFATTCYIGLAVGSGSDTTLNTSQFSNVSVTP